MNEVDAAGIAERYRQVVARAAAAAQAAGRDPGAVRVLLATKTQGVDAIRAAIAAGAALTGENRVEEAVAKAPGLAGLPGERHFIGHLQRNKAARLVGIVSCVETVDSPGLARMLSRRWDAAGEELAVYLQVNVSGEVQKSGCDPASALDLARQVALLPRLRVRGLMTIASFTSDSSRLSREYGLLRDLRDEIRASGAPGTAQVTELSMGMSHDFELAIAAGATEVRVGTAVFGPRTA